MSKKPPLPKPSDPRKKECSMCHGSGVYISPELNEVITCPWCGGTGRR